MSARDFIRANATPNDEALMTYESEQICAYADLENADFILQSKRYIHSGLDPSTPSMLLNSAQKLDTVENATGVFKGEKPYIVIATELINLDDAISPGEHLIRMLPTLGTLAYVVFDLEQKQLVYDGLKLAEKLPWNLDKILLTDRKISSVATGLNKQWFAWVLFSTHISRHSNRQPRFKSLGLQTPGRSPNDQLFQEPEMPEDLYAIHAHKSWIESAYDLLKLNKHTACESSGKDGKDTRLFFANVDSMILNEVVDKFGSQPHFAIMSIPWLEADDLGKMHQVLEIFTTKDKRKQLGPHLFATIIAPFWEDGSCLKPNSGIMLQYLNASKLRMGVTTDMKKKVCAQLKSFEKAGITLKEELTGDLLNGYDSDGTSSTVTASWSAITTVYLIGVPAYWREIQVKEVLGGKHKQEMVLHRSAFNAGEMHLATWRIQTPTADDLIGTVFKTKDGRRHLTVISNEDFQSKKRMARGKSAAAARAPQQQPNTPPVSISFAKRKRDEPGK